MSKLNSPVIWVVILGLFVTGLAGRTMAQGQHYRADKRVVAIDPGHGGDESGAVGPDGADEKTVALNLGKILKAELGRKYRVVLTRTEDSTMDLVSRTATANHHRADLFISIHTGGSFVHSTSGILIYHYQDFSKKSGRMEDGSTDQIQDKHAPVLWVRVQIRHLEKSRILAAAINASLNGSGPADSNRVRGAPLLLLQSADMPAVLIEIGYLTNPADEKKLNDQSYLTELAGKIGKGIDAFFKLEE